MKKFFTVVLSLISVLSFACFFACSGNDDENAEPLCEHEYVWETTTEPTCTENGERTGTCSKCGKTITEVLNATGHSYSEEYSFDGDYHWQETTCGHDDAIIKEEHSFNDDGKCTVCGYRTNKKPLLISNYDGIYDGQWLTEAAARFEEKYKGHVFSDGTVGVKVFVNSMKVTGPSSLGTVTNSGCHVFFMQDIGDYINQGGMLDLTDIVKESLTEYGESRSIEDKMTAEQRTLLQRGADGNKKYYAIPHYSGYSGITIDVDLFDENRLFMGADGNFGYISGNEGLSAGPDGINGTYDDGLPVTYADFYALCEEMTSQGIIPFCWSGRDQVDVTTMMAALCIDDVGFDQGKLQFTFDGTSDIITSFDNGAFVTGNVSITKENGYDVFKQTGFYNSLTFVEKIIRNGWYDSKSFFVGQTRIDAQDSFLASSKVSSKQPIGMLIGNSWWETEATGTFNIMAQRYENAGKYDRRFRFIPFPKSTEDKVGTGVTLVDSCQSYGFIRSDIMETDGAETTAIAKDFLQFLNTDESLMEFSRITNTLKALNYDMAEEDFGELTYYERSVLSIINAPTTNILYPSRSDIFNEDSNILDYVNRFTDQTMYAYPTIAFRDDENLTAETYFNDLTEYWENKWTSVI